MGRELRRREERKNKNKKVVTNQEDSDFEISGGTVLKVVSVIALLLLLIYFIVAIFVTKEVDFSDLGNEDVNTSTANSSSVSNKVLAQNIFGQAEERYYVYCYDFEDEEEGLQEVFSQVNDVTVYRLDTSSSLNSKYVTDGSGNKSATSLENLKISSPTLLVISGDKIEGYYEGKINIVNFLGEH